MKIFKSGLLLAMVLFLGFLVSFKMDEPAKEYAKITRVSNRIKIYFGDSSKELFTKQDDAEKDMLNLLNEYSKEGWKPVAFENFPGMTSTHIYLERVKR